MAENLIEILKNVFMDKWEKYSARYIAPDMASSFLSLFLHKDICYGMIRSVFFCLWRNKETLWIAPLSGAIRIPLIPKACCFKIIRFADVKNYQIRTQIFYILSSAIIRQRLKRTAITISKLVGWQWVKLATLSRGNPDPPPPLPPRTTRCVIYQNVPYCLQFLKLPA